MDSRTKFWWCQFGRFVFIARVNGMTEAAWTICMAIYSATETCIQQSEMYALDIQNLGTILWTTHKTFSKHSNTHTRIHAHAHHTLSQTHTPHILTPKHTGQRIHAKRWSTLNSQNHRPLARYTTKWNATTMLPNNLRHTLADVYRITRTWTVRLRIGDIVILIICFLVKTFIFTIYYYVSFFFFFRMLIYLCNRILMMAIRGDIHHWHCLYWLIPILTLLISFEKHQLLVLS